MLRRDTGVGVSRGFPPVESVPGCRAMDAAPRGREELLGDRCARCRDREPEPDRPPVGEYRSCSLRSPRQARSRAVRRIARVDRRVCLKHVHVGAASSPRPTRLVRTTYHPGRHAGSVLRGGIRRDCQGYGPFPMSRSSDLPIAATEGWSPRPQDGEIVGVTIQRFGPGRSCRRAWLSRCASSADDMRVVTITPSERKTNPTDSAPNARQSPSAEKLLQRKGVLDGRWSTCAPLRDPAVDYHCGGTVGSDPRRARWC